MAGKHLMGIDIGTSGTRVLLVKTNGTPVASVSNEYPCHSPKPLWSEQDPADWWSATCKGIKAVLRKAKVKKTDVIGIGLSGQMHGSVFLDENDEVIRPAILWNDQRTAQECEEITQTFSYDGLIKLTCNPALTGFTAPKIQWLRKNEKANWNKVRKILLPKDYIRLKLTGEYATEVSDASGTLLFDVQNRKWSDEVLAGLDIEPEFMPRCYESPEVTGQVTDEAGKATGLEPGIPVVGGGGDQAAGAIGGGIVKSGIVSATMGTSGVVFAYSDRPQFDPYGRLHTFCHAVPGKWHVMGVVLCAGGSFQWLRNTLGDELARAAKRKKKDPYELLTEAAGDAPAGCEGLVFLPYLTGERTPHADPYARGGWIGLTTRHGRSHMVRSVMEGATFAMNDSLELIRGLGVRVNEIRLLGGGARSKLWRQIQTDIYRSTTVTINTEEGPAYGVALLAGVGAGVWDSVQEACKAAIKTRNKTRPRKGDSATYRKLYEIYRKLYPALKPTYDDIALFMSS